MNLISAHFEEQNEYITLSAIQDGGCHQIKMSLICTNQQNSQNVLNESCFAFTICQMLQKLWHLG
jgi:hypothetical protein